MREVREKQRRRKRQEKREREKESFRVKSVENLVFLILDNPESKLACLSLERTYSQV